MSLDLNYRQLTVLVAVVVGSAVAIIGYLSGALVPAAIFLVIQACALGVLLWLTRPNDGAFHVTHVAAQAAAGERDVIVYWRPG